MNINDIAKQDFMNYAMGVIKDRAIPNIEDNLKPVHRRVLYSMYLAKLWSHKGHVKNAAIVGDTMKIHPHGDQSIYDALIRLGQPWKSRYPLIDIQGNKGNMSGASAAAMRYTEGKLTPIGDIMVSELKDKCVPMIHTYDGIGNEPFVMPSAFPNILCNGNMGIAVGMSSALIPHNLKEVVQALIKRIDNPMLTIEELLRVLPGPDFPTGGIVTNIDKVAEVYTSGSGTFEVRGKYRVESKGKYTHLVFTEIPYLVNIETGIIDKIKELAAEGIVDEIYNIENNTGRNGLEIRIILKPSANISKVLKILFDNTRLSSVIRVGMTVLQNDRPVSTNIFGLLDGFIGHRHNVLTTTASNNMTGALERLHMVEGLMIAVQDIDGVIEIVKASSSRGAAKTTLQRTYKLSEIQAGAILDMKVSQINKMDTQKLAMEEKALHSNIDKYDAIINKKEVRNKLIKNSLIDLSTNYGDDRRTVLENSEIDVVNEKHKYLILLHPDNEVSVIDDSTIAVSAKGRVGKKLVNKRVIQAINFSTEDTLLLFDGKGRSYKVDNRMLAPGMNQYMLDIDSRIKGEIQHIVSITEDDAAKEYLVFVTQNGTVKKTKVADYNNFKTASIAIKLRDGDSILRVRPANDTDFVLIMGDEKLNKFSVKDVTSTGKNTIGSKGISANEVVAAEIASDSDHVCMTNKDGKGKYVIVSTITNSVRAGRGQIVYKGTASMDKLFGTTIALVSDTGSVLKIKKDDVPKRLVKAVGVKLLSVGLDKIAT